MTALEVAPKDVAIHLGQAVDFAALAKDAKGQTVSGGRVTWSAQTSDKTPAEMSQTGTFRPAFPDTFTVSATDGTGHSASTTLTVTVKTESTKSPGSTTDVPDVVCQGIDPGPVPDNSVPSEREPPDPAVVFRPANRRGTNTSDGLVSSPGVSPRVAQELQKAGASDFGFSAPVLSTPGVNEHRKARAFDHEKRGDPRVGSDSGGDGSPGLKTG